MAEMMMVPLPTEPVEVKESLKAAEPMVRRASLRQASDIVTPIYDCWKDQLQVGGVTWSSFQAAASSNATGGRTGWRTRSLGRPQSTSSSSSSISIEARIGFGCRWAARNKLIAMRKLKGCLPG